MKKCIFLLAVFAMGAVILAKGIPAYAATICSLDPLGLGIPMCNYGEQCSSSLGCTCDATPIISGDICNAPCNFNGVNFLSGSSTTGYKYNTVPFGSSCTAVGNYQIMTCQTSTRGPSIGIFSYSSCTVVPPVEGYCSFDPLGLGKPICNDNERCNSTSCVCNGVDILTPSQCHFSCPASIETVSGHIYNVPSTTYGSGVSVNTGIGIGNGTQNYTQQFICSGGIFLTTGTELSGAVSCNGGYNRNGTSCVYAGGGGGGGGGGYYIPTCTFTDLMCINTTYQMKPGVSCQGGNFGNACGTGIILTGGTNGSIAGSTYSNELNQAYLRAFQWHITTMPTIQQANMLGKLQRRDLAKMMSNFAIRILDQQPNTGRQCVFTDMNHESVEMKYYAKLACQLGIMGLNSNGTPATTFNPAGIVTRGIFGTTLSRTIWGNKNNVANPFYLKHLQALQASGIMNNISLPATLEIRGYVMLMMQRAYTLLQ